MHDVGLASAVDPRTTAAVNTTARRAKYTRPRQGALSTTRPANFQPSSRTYINVNPVGPSTNTVSGRSSVCCAETGGAPTAASAAVPHPFPSAFQPGCNRQPSSAERTSVRRSPPGPLRKMVGADFCVSVEASPVWPNAADVPAASAEPASTATSKCQDIENVRERFIFASCQKGPGRRWPTCEAKHLSHARGAEFPKSATTAVLGRTLVLSRRFTASFAS